VPSGHFYIYKKKLEIFNNVLKNQIGLKKTKKKEKKKENKLLKNNK
jgi:hypothetical protein